MKKAFSVFVSLFMIVSFSISAFAVDMPLSDAPLIYEKDGDTYFGTLITSELPENAKDFIRAWLKSDRNMMSFQNGFVIFTIYSADTVISSVQVNPNKSSYANIYFKNGYKYSALVVSTRTGKFSLDYDNCNVSGTSLNYTNSNTCAGTLISGTIFKKYNNLSLPSSALLNFKGRFIIVDDDGLLEGEPEEPEEPDIPDTTDTIHVPASKPSFPNAKTDALPYDISVWDDFTEYIRTAIGSVGVVLIMTTFLFVAIGCVFAVIRHYLNQGKSDGGSDSGLI